MIASVPIACLFRTAWPRDTAKHAANAAGLSVRTAQGWMSERFTPSAATLLRMADRNDKLRAELIKRLALQQGYTDASLEMGVLPVDGKPTDAARRKAHGPRARVASEG
jgi:hypothetical protein